MPDFDVAVIGAGSAGLSFTSVAAQLGLRVALIERDRMGGDCLNTGCVPSKALLAAADAARDAARAGRLGIRARAEPDWDAVRTHVHGVIAAIAPADSEARYASLGATVLRAEARFAGPDRLSVAGHGTLSARRVVIAAGSRPAIPDLPGLEHTPFVTHETLFELTERPDHLLILGGGAIALEMADAFAGLGVQVTVISRGPIASREDPELVDVLRHALSGAGVGLLENAVVTRAQAGPALILADGRRITGSHLLVATGRIPNTGDLALDLGGVGASVRGVATDRGLRSLTNRRVFAIGDIADPSGIGPRYHTHAASHHAGVVIRRAVFRLPARVDDATMPRVIYSDPELAQVGLTEAQARAGGQNDIRVLRWCMADNDRAQTERRTDGLVKLVVGRRNRVLGAGIVAPHAGEMIGVWTLAIARGVPLAALADLIVPYPTRAEAGKRAAGSRFAAALFAPRTRFFASVLTRLP